MYDFGMKKWTFLAELPFDSCIKCFMFLPISSVVFSNKMGKRYRLGQANLQFSLFQSLGILIVWNVDFIQKSYARVPDMTKIVEFDLLKLSNLTL